VNRISHLKEIKIQNQNSLIFILYLLQYSLMFPINLIIGSQFPIVISTLSLLMYCIITNRFKFNLKLILLLFLPLMFLLLKLPFEKPDNSGINIALSYLKAFLTIGVSGVLIGSLKFSSKQFFYYAYKVSWIILLFFIFIPFTSYYGDDVNYMRYGYGILPAVIIFYIFLFQKKQFLRSIVGFSISFTLLLFFGARGSLLSFLFFLVTFTFLFSSIKKRTKHLIFLVLSVIIYNIKPIIIYLFNIITEFNLSSYSLTKLLNYLNGNSFASTSSGRSEAFELAILKIWESPFLGLPLNTAYLDTGLIYYHNLFLDILVNWGVIIFSFFLGLIMLFIYKTIKTPNKNIKIIFILIFCLSITRLLVSSNYFERPEFWVLMSYGLTSISTNNKSLN
tara:strand:+ start:927 stop:2102 length:1176 start_codon:yes stop_codon:yes gene_type:complete